MKTVILAVCFLLIASMAEAIPVSQLVFSIISSPVTATPNLRVAVMATKQIAMSQNVYPIQAFVLRAGAITDYYLTKSTTVPLPDDMGVWVQVDQATTMKVNSETQSMILPSGFNSGFIIQ